MKIQMNLPNHLESLICNFQFRFSMYIIENEKL